MRDSDEVRPSELEGRVDVVVDRFRVPMATPKTNGDSRVVQGVEAAWRASAGTAALHFVGVRRGAAGDGDGELRFFTRLASRRRALW